MPTDKKYPFELPVLDAFDEKQGPHERVIYVEDVLPWMGLGCSPSEIAKQLDTTYEVVSHLIMLIPDMMAWREQDFKSTHSETGARKLPTPREQPLQNKGV